MKVLIATILFFISMTAVAQPKKSIVYPAVRYSCLDLSNILYSQGRIHVADDRKVYKIFTWESRPTCVSGSGAPAGWRGFTIRAATGLCDLGVICRELPENEGKESDRYPPCSAIGCDYPGKPDNEN